MIYILYFCIIATYCLTLNLQYFPKASLCARSSFLYLLATGQCWSRWSWSMTGRGPSLTPAAGSTLLQSILSIARTWAALRAPCWCPAVLQTTLHNGRCPSLIFRYYISALFWTGSVKQDLYTVYHKNSTLMHHVSHRSKASTLLVKTSRMPATVQDSSLQGFGWACWPLCSWCSFLPTACTWSCSFAPWTALMIQKAQRFQCLRVSDLSQK